MRKSVLMVHSECKRAIRTAEMEAVKDSNTHSAVGDYSEHSYALITAITDGVPG